MHANAEAKAIIARADVLALEGGVLSAVDREAQNALTRAMASTLYVAKAITDGTRALHRLPSPLPLIRPGGHWPIVLRFFVAPTPGARRMGLIKLRDTARQSLPTSEAIAAATPLTIAEARIGLALLEGDAPTEIAEATGLSEHTIRTHIRAIRTKLGVSRQSSIVAQLARLMGS